MKISEVLKQPELVSVLGLGLLLALLVMAFLAGRASAPIKTIEKQVVVTKTEVEIREVEKQVVVEKIVEQKIYVKEEKKAIRRERTETQHPDGTFVKKETEDINIDRVQKETEVQFVDREVVVYRDRAVEVEKQVVVEKEKKVEVAKDWHVSAGIGTNVLEVSPKLTVPYFEPFVVGVSVERRIIGPVWLGVAGDSTGTGTLRVGVEF